MAPGTASSTIQNVVFAASCETMLPIAAREAKNPSISAKPEVSMAGAKLDDIDRRILAELQADGRMTNVELARRVGISAPP